ncbi:PAS domain S-box protein, partial [Burkholderia ubonensis]|uniref:PAS domain S-box protein n=1 Tax=Burkholderia ubonensis TaxID=101571 RepID=UPI000ADA7CA9
MTAHVPSSNATPTLRRAGSVNRATWAALLTLAIGVVASFAAASVVQIRSHDAARAQFERDATRVTARLQHNLLDATAVLRGARSFAVATAAQPGDAWQHYVAGLDLDSLQSPVHTVGVISEASAADDDQATQRALRRAAETGKAALAARLVRDSADATANRPDLALYLPIGTGGDAPTVGGRQRVTTTEFVYAGLDTHRLFDLPSVAPLGLRVTTDNPQTIVYASESPSERDSVQRTDTLTFGGTTLSLAYSAPLPDASGTAIAVLLAGLALSLAFAVCVHQAIARGQHQPGAPGSGSPLSEARMMGIIRSSMEAIITIDESQTIVIFNPAAEHVFGVSAMDAIGAPLSRFIPERFRASHAKHV